MPTVFSLDELKELGLVYYEKDEDKLYRVDSHPDYQFDPERYLAGYANCYSRREFTENTPKLKTILLVDLLLGVETPNEYLIEEYKIVLEKLLLSGIKIFIPAGPGRFIEM